MSTDDLLTRLEAACSIDGKPTGRHMIAGQKMLAAHFLKSNEDEARLFDNLRTVALEAAAEIRRLRDEVGRLRQGRNLRANPAAIEQMARAMAEQDFAWKRANGVTVDSPLNWCFYAEGARAAVAALGRLEGEE